MFKAFFSEFIKKPLSMSIALSSVISCIIGIIFALLFKKSSAIIYTFIFGVFFILPITLTIVELISLFKKDMNCFVFDITVIILGIFFSYILLNIHEVNFICNWYKQLVNCQLHSPIYTKSYITVIVIALIGFLGYILLRKINIKKTPPLIPVIAISSMYLGTLESIIWIIQLSKQISDFTWLYLILFPLNCIIICCKSIYKKVTEWNNEEHTNKIYNSYVLNKLSILLQNAKVWPIAAFVIMWPLLGIIISILLLFGQEPDSIIKAWTETSDWTLSNKVAPQNIYEDEHYLCTVAAGGHRKIVKPLRMGLRHGHKVIVNRQLCIANAFEEILEEKTPRFHKIVRGFYDKYGFPVAKLINSKWIADLVYFLMKPLEYIFLIFIYLVDVNPENRIATQYMK